MLVPTANLLPLGLNRLQNILKQFLSNTKNLGFLSFLLFLSIKKNSFWVKFNFFIFSLFTYFFLALKVVAFLGCLNFSYISGCFLFFLFCCILIFFNNIQNKKYKSDFFYYFFSKRSL